MDLNLYLRVIWRFRYLVVVGVVFAAVLAGLAMYKVSFHGGSPKLSYRDQQTYSSNAVLLVTQQGFPEGRTVLPYSVANVGGQQTAVPSFADPGRFTDLALFYSTLAQSDAVFELAHARNPRLSGSWTASPVTLGGGSRVTALPLFQITGSAHSPRGAVQMARAGTTAFITYLAKQQAAARVPVKDRILVNVVNEPQGAVLTVARKKTIPIVVFLTVLVAALGLAFILENLRPLVRPLDLASLERAPDAANIRSA